MGQTTRRKILFYCQSLVGIGHLTSSLQVIRELLSHSDVDLIYGGQSVPQMPELAGFRHLRLPTILIDSATNELMVPDEDFSLEQIWKLRKSKIEQFVTWPYDALIIEFFPFGRRRLKKEIMHLFALFNQASPKAPIFSFVREILVPEPPEIEQRIVDLIQKHIHTVFIRGDQNIVRFEETFAMTAKIKDRIRYIGYVSQPATIRWPVRENKIIVSQGGGEIGMVMLRAAILTAPLLKDYRFIIVTSSRASELEKSSLKKLVSSANVEIVPFLENFQSHLLTAALSVSLGGDNTLMDVISTRTPALAFPYTGNSEQLLRIERLSQIGFVGQLSLDDLVPEQFCKRIKTALGKPYPKQKIAINGSVNMSREITEILEEVNIA